LVDWFKFDPEYYELERYISEDMMNKVLSDYASKIKIIMLFVMLLIPPRIYVGYLDAKIDPVAFEAFVKYLLIVLAFCIFVLLVLEFLPKRIIYLVPPFIALIIFGITHRNLSRKEYSMDEFIPAATNFCCLLIIIVPIQWKLNSIIYT
jgi:hypothetical protein